MCIGDGVGTRVENILYFFKARVVGKHGRKDIVECWKGLKRKSFEATGAEKDIIKYKILCNQNDFIDNLYDHGLSMFSN
jgi:hypothetical protein